MKKTTVLIVGAGPTGLMLACQLALHKVPFLIVEKESGPTTESRALGIQARTMEIFRQMGIVEQFLREGKQASGLNFLAEGKLVQHIPLTGLGTGLTEFPFLFTLEQSKTEANLVSFLKKHEQTIHWNTEVISFTQNSSNVISIVKDKTGREETIESEWIIGADGAHSIVRHTLGIPLAGKTYKQSLFVLDCLIESELSKDDVTVASSDVAFAAFFPMAGGRWRIVGEVPESAYEKDQITFEEVKANLGKRVKLALKLSDPVWISLYHAHHRCVEKFREGRAFLMGDASNIHSPIGAQGMNTGLQDAYNLAWKFAFVSQNKAHESILSTYNEERLPVARKLVETTDRLFNLFIARNSPAVFFRERILPKIMGNIVSHRKTGEIGFRTISQIGISYHDSILSQDASVGEFPEDAPIPGDRLPYLLYKENKREKNIQEIVNSKKMSLLFFSKNATVSEDVTSLIKAYATSIEVITITFTPDTVALFSAFGIVDEGFYLIRPDMYVAYRSNTRSVEHFSSYLTRFFIPHRKENDTHA